MLLRGLPAEARLARVPGDEVTWTTDTELLACLLEELSVLTSERRRRKPLEIPRPGTLNRARDPESKVRGTRALVAAATAAGRVRT